MRISRKGSVLLFSFSFVNLIPLKMLLIVLYVFSSWSFFVMTKVSSIYQIHILDCMHGSAIDSKCCMYRFYGTNS